MQSNQPKVAFVHDDFVQNGGAENLFAEIASIFPEAPIYTSLVDWSKLPTTIARNRVRPSFMQKIPSRKMLYKPLLPLYQLAFESFDFDGFDIVISSTTRFAKSIITKPETIHMCYINSIPRFLWDKETKSHYVPSILERLTSPIFNWLKRADYAAGSRPDFYLANSKNVAEKIKKNYGREAEILYPFIDLTIFKPSTTHYPLPTTNFAKQNISFAKQNISYFLIVSRLVKWKKIDIAIKACQALGVNLRIVGTGPDEGRLRKIATDHQRPKSSVSFLGKIDQKSLISLYQNAKAFIVTQEEDFGLSALEAQACGTPVIAYARGGVPEIIQANKTGILFENQTAKSCQDAIVRAKEVKWVISDIVKNTQKFTKDSFVRTIKKYIKLHAKQP